MLGLSVKLIRIIDATKPENATTQSPITTGSIYYNICYLRWVLIDINICLKNYLHVNKDIHYSD